MGALSSGVRPAVRCSCFCLVAWAERGASYGERNYWGGLQGQAGLVDEGLGLASPPFLRARGSTVWATRSCDVEFSIPAVVTFSCSIHPILCSIIIVERWPQVDIVVATPGRLLDHLEQTPGFTLQHLRYLVIDEADRLLNQSYQNWVAKVIKAAYRCGC